MFAHEDPFLGGLNSVIKFNTLCKDFRVFSVFWATVTELELQYLIKVSLIKKLQSALYVKKEMAMFILQCYLSFKAGEEENVIQSCSFNYPLQIVALLMTL